VFVDGAARAGITLPPSIAASPNDGAIFEAARWRSPPWRISSPRARHARRLFIDYGHAQSGTSADTLQAVRAHRYEEPLVSPGEGRPHSAGRLRSPSPPR